MCPAYLSRKSRLTLGRNREGRYEQCPSTVCTLSADDALARWRGDAWHGLSSGEAAQRLAQYRPNEIAEKCAIWEMSI